MTGMWAQWDAQTNDRHIAYIELNNLYLSLESGRVKLTRWKWNRLQILMGIAYPYCYPVNQMVQDIRDYWAKEFMKLDGWYQF